MSRPEQLACTTVHFLKTKNRPSQIGDLQFSSSREAQRIQQWLGKKQAV
jgi:hypothetical protein